MKEQHQKEIVKFQVVRSWLSSTAKKHNKHKNTLKKH